ncbi:MAG: hypothetical protein AB7O64_02790 [Methylibium sp.]
MSEALVEAIVHKLLDHLAGWGFPVGVQQRLGSFVIIWGVVETSLESAVWALGNEEVQNRRPSTDKTSASAWFEEFKSKAKALDSRLDPISDLAVNAAVQVMNYRHAVAHGWLLPDAVAPTFYRNPNWNGEVRNRPKGVARVTEEELDLAIDAAWTLAIFIMVVRDACSNRDLLDGLDKMTPDLIRAIAAGDRLDAHTQLMLREELQVTDRRR